MTVNICAVCGGSGRVVDPDELIDYCCAACSSTTDAPTEAEASASKRDTGSADPSRVATRTISPLFVMGKGRWFDIVIEPDLSKRGETRLVDGVIALREWDEEVLLHECLHAVLHDGTFVNGTYNDPSARRVHEDEEDLVGHVSRALHAMGWRLRGEPT